MADLMVHEVAEMLGVHVDTVRRYANSGKLRAMRDYNNYRRFSYGDVTRLKNELENLKPDNA